ncbi:MULTISPECIES: hypothetical protein [Bradyrhizobium]|jgi:hypothetical protein|uniref:Phasin domain-containing protein n=1 Tax=Bradyrhizobium elkanii TaxID=29448 RepID=A0A8I1Y372_BRAEL|nr:MULTISPECIES: hypothetical protein [Bradyrhizobium]MBP1293689.1 hypothetical protein [Bradyrhizobium elkanii]MCP1925730.1 hypothetical protein [Bradyrhizobium elkanii]MCS3451364.1 hypothetical protein [Bradyrhizobium elkanii]MCS3476781.1 hypothetical protein [Bradyrhizobium elkanii]MCS3566611.1 hypothetical protein [Bradyrhizobium elkanii]
MTANITEDEKRERRARPEPGLAQASGGGPDGLREAAAAASRIPLIFPEWEKSIEATRHLFATALKDGLSFAASSLHDQANFLRNLSDSKTPSELLKCHLDFAEKFWSKSFSQGSKILDHLKPQPSSAASQAIHRA